MMQRKLNLDEWQKKVLGTEGHIVLRSGRQVGKSTIIATKAAIFAMKNKQSHTMVIAATDRQSKLLLQKILNQVMEINNRVIKGGKDKPTQHRIVLKNGSEILSFPAGRTGYGIRGYTLDLLIGDEAAFINEDVWQAVTPMLAMTGGVMWLLSTPHGRGGYFYDCFLDDDFTKFHISTENVLDFENRPEVQKESLRKRLKAEKKRMSELEYAQEYLGEFADNLQQLFSDDIIKETCIINRRKEIRRRDRRYYLGSDIAGMGEDETTLEILDKISQENIEQVENIVKKKQRTTQISDFIKALDKSYNFCKIGVDDAGIGFGVWSELRDDDRTKRKVVGLNNRRRSLGEGDRTKKLMKEEMYLNLLRMMEKRQIKLLEDDEVVQSLKSVQYEYIRGEKGEIRLRIFGSYTHIAEGLIRAAWLASNKTLNVFARRF